MLRFLLLLFFVGAFWCGAEVMGVPMPPVNAADMAGSIKARLMGAGIIDPARLATEADGHAAAVAVSDSLLSEASFEKLIQAQRGQIEAAINARDPSVDAGKFIDTVMLPEFRRHKSELPEVVAGVLVRHFTAAELVRWRAFTDSPPGRKINQLGPTLTAETYQAGQEWGQRLGRQSAAAHASEQLPNVIH